jgi:ATP-dependent Lon protease
VLSDHGLTPEQLAIDDETLRKIIADYTLEAGVRGLKKQLAAIAPLGRLKRSFSNEAELPVDCTYLRSGGAFGQAGFPPRPCPAG